MLIWWSASKTVMSISTIDRDTITPSSIFHESAQYAWQPIPSCLSSISTMKAQVTIVLSLQPAAPMNEAGRHTAHISTRLKTTRAVEVAQGIRDITSWEPPPSRGRRAITRAA